MDKNYLKAKEIIDNARGDLNNIFVKAECKGVENEAAYRLLENIIEKLEDIAKGIKYLGSPTKEGILVEDSNGKYFIEYDDGSKSYNLSCGNTLELLYNDEWQIGRVEAKDGEYYFYGEGIPFLHNGMRARKRIID